MVFENLSVMPADRRVIQHHLAIRMPTEDGSLTLQLDELPGQPPFDDFQIRHSERILPILVDLFQSIFDKKFRRFRAVENREQNQTPNDCGNQTVWQGQNEKP